MKEFKTKKNLKCRSLIAKVRAALLLKEYFLSLKTSNIEFSHGKKKFKYTITGKLDTKAAKLPHKLPVNENKTYFDIRQCKFLLRVYF